MNNNWRTYGPCIREVHLVKELNKGAFVVRSNATLCDIFIIAAMIDCGDSYVVTKACNLVRG